MKEMTSFAGWNLVVSSTSMIGNYGIGLVLNHFFGTILNAAQSIASQLSGMLMVFSNSMLKALNPVITKQEGAGMHNQMIKNAVTGSKFSFLLMAVFAYPCIIEMPYILKIWLKNVPAWAVVFTQLQLVRILVEQLTIVLGTAITAEGHIKNYYRIKSIVYIIPLIVTSILFAAGFPPVTMYAVLLVCYMLSSLITVIFAHKNCKMEYSFFFRDLLLPIIGMTIIVFAISLLPSLLLPSTFLRVGITCFISTATMCLCVLIIVLNKDERQKLYSAFFSLNRKLNKFHL